MQNKYYIARLYAYNNNFRLKSNDMYEDVNNGKKMLQQIIVKKGLFGYKEMITGLTIYELNSFINCNLNRFPGIFIINDSLTFKENMIEIPKEDIYYYLKKYKNENDKAIFSSIIKDYERESYKYFYKAIGLQEINKLIKCKKRYK